MNIDDCPIEHVSLHVKIKELVKIGVLEEKPVYHAGFGQGSFMSYNGHKIKIKRKVKGTPRWENGVPDGLYFHDSHDVAYDVETGTLLAWAHSI
jgi:hypothetical protein